ncbi:hypothetical protein A3A39_03225 [Candidatus Kaiserbacteria bacterium RIFCSPLOWO2_01_FULL_54_13]|uniref:Transcriptional repressor PaaX-like central Cas2-like domain-containing protein n=1 Tax=Candidatus Kaiserbacteria bacterium RIFCSPLOWO2_01_FULL_54_13 TaxID=1798512 RepID=A0A1F6F4E4_9BACT|nr:MAG: hypothetical protein A3A39_03225 [Candidatus Kaiserbacteria bacterium RIFCSPLOWO2_01_FULL_54_13]
MYKYRPNQKQHTDTHRKRRREKTVQILKLVALGVVLMGIGAVPSPRAVSRIFKELALKDTKQNHRTIKRKIWEMSHRGYIEKSPKKYELSEIGQRIIEKEKLWNLRIQTPKKWDDTWHIVVFDIPQERRNIRIAFIRHLQQLGLVFYQRSVWIYPYAMEDEVREIAAFFDILPFISFIKANHVDNSYDLKKYFKLI